jgi:hypothetical protein
MGRGRGKATCDIYGLDASVYRDLTLSAIAALNARDFRKCESYLAELLTELEENE